MLALGSSRQPEALAILKSFAEEHSGEQQEVAHVALALLRLPAALDYLLTLVAGSSEAAATSALDALAVYRHDPSVRKRTADAVAKNGATALRTLFEKRFRTNE